VTSIRFQDYSRPVNSWADGSTSIIQAVQDSLTARYSAASRVRMRPPNVPADIAEPGRRRPGYSTFTEIPGRDADRNPMVKEKVYPLTLVTRFSLDRKLSMAMRKP
jgi:hypothetical protein